MPKIRRVLILPDMQVPFEDKRTLKAVEKYMADHMWQEVIYLGDFMDFDCISRFNAEALRNLEGRRIAEDYAKGNAILDRHQAIVGRRNKKAKWVFLEGNHELRIEKLLDKQPQLQGMVEVEKGLRLKERGFKWVRCYQKGELYRVGNAYFHHGRYTNKYHAYKMVDHYGVSIYYGHTHDVMSMPKVAHGKDKTLEGHSLGCLCDYKQSYIGGNPTNWQQAFAVMHVRPNGFYNLYVTRIFNHSFISPEGKSYDPS